MGACNRDRHAVALLRTLSCDSPPITMESSASFRAAATLGLVDSSAREEGAGVNSPGSLRGGMRGGGSTEYVRRTQLGSTGWVDGVASVHTYTVQ